MLHEAYYCYHSYRYYRPVMSALPALEMINLRIYIVESGLELAALYHALGTR